MRFSRLFVFAVLISIVPFDSFAVDRTKVERQFAEWVRTSLWQKAQANGITAATFNEALTGIKPNWKLPGLRPPGAKASGKTKQSQSEFRSPAAYFREKNLQSDAGIGRKLLTKWAGTLERIEQIYGVPGHILVAIWGRESAYGRAKIPHSAIRVLATKAFMSTRKQLFFDELIAALKIIEQRNITRNAMKSSWAGALGQPQFMPSSYLKFAVDFDGDGKKDIWNSVPDTLASIANYLNAKGWQRERDWGFEVAIPGQTSCAQEGPDKSQLISGWVANGIKRISGRRFPGHELNGDGMMLVPAGRGGPHFIVTPNFYVIKSYNNSDLYALYVGNLGDRMAYGSGKFQRPWGETDTMYRSDIATIQRALEGLGYDVGGADGLPGFKTRRSIGDWQLRNNQPQTCFPSNRLIKTIR